jgi:esterase/lipase superfamily enzyme
MALTETTLLFATNRVQEGMEGALPNFTSDCRAPEQPIVCATATITGIDPRAQDSGTVAAVGPLSEGAFSEGDLAPLLASPRDVLVFVHGAENDFKLALTRAAYNKSWLWDMPAADGRARNYDVVTFTWPGMSYPIESVEDLPGALEGYNHDRSMAGHSNAHVAAFLRLMAALRGRLGTRKLHLLCHSMGVYALGGGVETLFREPGAPTAPVFDQILLAAGDEDLRSFTMPDGERLSNLHRLGQKIAVYFNRNDIAMHASRVANGFLGIFGLSHLGFYGPVHMQQVDLFPKEGYAFVNCGGLTDYIAPVQGDHTHQYYRESPTVRADIASVLAGDATRPLFYADENFSAFVAVDFSGQT